MVSSGHLKGEYLVHLEAEPTSWRTLYTTGTCGNYTIVLITSHLAYATPLRLALANVTQAHEIVIPMKMHMSVQMPI